MSDAKPPRAVHEQQRAQEQSKLPLSRLVHALSSRVRESIQKDRKSCEERECSPSVSQSAVVRAQERSFLCGGVALGFSITIEAAAEPPYLPFPIIVLSRLRLRLRTRTHTHKGNGRDGKRTGGVASYDRRAVRRSVSVFSIFFFEIVVFDFDRARDFGDGWVVRNRVQLGREVRRQQHRRRRTVSAEHDDHAAHGVQSGVAGAL